MKSIKGQVQHPPVYPLNLSNNSFYLYYNVYSRWRLDQIDEKKCLHIYFILYVLSDSISICAGNGCVGLSKCSPDESLVDVDENPVSLDFIFDLPVIFDWHY